MPSETAPSDDPVALQAMLAAERVENERLRKIIRELQRHRFGRRAESLPLDQLQLGLEEAEQAEAADEALAEAAVPTVRAARTAKRRANRGSLPAHLPRIETVVDIADDSCPCCSAPLHRIGEDVSERLDVVPAQFRVLVVRRPKYACRACTDGVARTNETASRYAQADKARTHAALRDGSWVARSGLNPTTVSAISRAVAQM